MGVVVLNSEAVKSFFGITENVRELELGAASSSGPILLVEDPMLALFSCQVCRSINRLHFRARPEEDLCGTCGHDRRQAVTPQENRGGISGSSKADFFIPILVAIGMLLVFGVFVFWTAFAR